MRSSVPPPQAGPFHDHVVGTILGPLGERLVAAASLRAGQRVLDVACGTGAVSGPARRAVAPAGSVTAVDLAAAMLAVGRAAAAAVNRIHWLRADAGALPLAAASFDAVLCGHGLQFFPDRAAALGEMVRVLRPRGRLALSVWCPVAASPYFAALHAAVLPHLDEAAAAVYRRPFTLGDPDELSAALAGAGLGEIDVARVSLRLRLPPLDRFVRDHMRASPIADRLASLDPAAVSAVIAGVAGALAGSAGRGVPFSMLIARAVRVAEDR